MGIVVCWNVSMDRVCVKWPNGKQWHTVYGCRIVHNGREWSVGTMTVDLLPSR